MDKTVVVKCELKNWLTGGKGLHASIKVWSINTKQITKWNANDHPVSGIQWKQEKYFGQNANRMLRDHQSAGLKEIESLRASAADNFQAWV